MADATKPSIALLGGFAAAVSGTPVPDGAWRLRKAKELVKLLALAEGHRLHREQAMEALWPGRDPRSSANNLNQVVHAARRALGAEAVPGVDGVLRLEADVDVDAFEHAAADARLAATAQAYERALDLYAGELLPENRYDDWASPARERLALLRDALEEELEALGGTRPARRGLPLDASSFVGREHELGDLRALLRRTRLLTLTGTGGAGKTRLALELGRDAAPGFADGAVLVELDAVSDGSRVPDAVAEALDVLALPGGSVLGAIVQELASRELLLVLDNCEHVIGASAALADALLRSTSGLTVLATSREPLRVPGEIVFRVPSLAIPDPDRPAAAQELLRYEAVRLFVDRAVAVAPTFALDEATAPAVARVCHRLDGIPLALELAAARVDALTPAALAARLDDRFALLRAGRRAAPTRQQTLEAALRWSHDLLTEPERVLFRRLAIFSGGFELEAAEDVCAGDGIARVDVADLLARLVEKSLVTSEDRRGSRRYRLLETIRAYATDRLDADGEHAAVARRHAAWLAELVERQDDYLSELDAERGNLRVALATLLGTDPAAGLALGARVWPFWVRRIELAEARRWLGDALELAPAPCADRVRALLGHAALEYRGGDEGFGTAKAEEALELARALGDARLEWRALQFRAGIEMAGDQGAAAAGWHRQALDLARSHGLAAAEAASVYSLGAAAWMAGDLAEAEAWMAEGFQLFGRLASHDETVPALLGVAEVTLPQRGAPGLRHVFEDTLQPFHEVTCEVAAGYVLLNWANVARSAGDAGRGRSLLDRALAHFERCASDRGCADAWGRLANVELADGRAEAAAELFERVRALRTELGDRRGIALALVGLGRAAAASGAERRAERLLLEAAETFRRAGDRWGLASTLWRTSELELERGRLEVAEQRLEEALRVLDETRRARWQAITRVNLAELALLRGDAERARALFESALPALERDDQPAAAYVRERLAALAKEAQRERKAAAGTTGATRSTRRRNA